MTDENTLQLTSKVSIAECETFPQALSTATEEAGNTGGHAYPVVMFRQGKRISFSGALPMKRVESFLDLQRSAAQGRLDGQVAGGNKSSTDSRAHGRHRQLHQGKSRGLHHSGLTINVQAPINVYTAKGSSTIKSAYMVVPDTAPASPTDGQHRAHGILKALEEMDPEKRASFAQDGVAFMLTCESNIEKAHQDFADCSKTSNCRQPC